MKTRNPFLKFAAFMRERHFKRTMVRLENERLQHILQDYECTLDELKARFSKEIVLTLPKCQDRYFIQKEKCCNAITIVFLMAEYEKPKLDRFIRKQRYVLNYETTKGNQMHQNKNDHFWLYLNNGVKFKPATLNPNFQTYFDEEYEILTNDSEFAANLCKNVFEMSPPWFVFDDYTYAFRNTSWRMSWNAFWRQLSDEEKNGFFERYKVSKEWNELLKQNGFEYKKA